MTTLSPPHTEVRRADHSDAAEPPEAHGLARDAVKLLVAQSSGVSHARFADLGEFLTAGDLLVVNNSLTLPAALDGVRAGRPIAVHFSTACSKSNWVVELRPATQCDRPPFRRAARRACRPARRRGADHRDVISATGRRRRTVVDCPRTGRIPGRCRVVSDAARPTDPLFLRASAMAARLLPNGVRAATGKC